MYQGFTSKIYFMIFHVDVSARISYDRKLESASRITLATVLLPDSKVRHLSSPEI